MAYYIAPPFNGEVAGNRILWETRGELVWLEPYGPNVIRFRSTPSLRMDEARNWTLLPPLPSPDVSVTVDERQGVL
ncbi:MAG: glycoside hydrolase family 31 protein, partial [Eubacteriales bacterium]|nr:glycoside hydrolase family 31 protein [Eubacteriales bacterium]